MQKLFFSLYIALQFHGRACRHAALQHYRTAVGIGDAYRVLAGSGNVGGVLISGGIVIRAFPTKGKRPGCTCGDNFKGLAGVARANTAFYALDFYGGLGIGPYDAKK